MNTNPKRQGMAITSLVLGILSMVCFGFIMGYASLLTTLVVMLLAARLLPQLPQAKSRAQSIVCIKNLKQIGLSFRVWATENADRFAFAVPTQEGGTLELQAEGSDGFDQNPARIFQVMSNELATPKLLICPADASKRPAFDFRNLQAGNVSYQVRSGTNVNLAHPWKCLPVAPSTTTNSSAMAVSGSGEEAIPRAPRSLAVIPRGPEKTASAPLSKSAFAVFGTPPFPCAARQTCRWRLWRTSLAITALT